MEHCRLKDCGSNSWWGSIPGLWVWSPIGAHRRGNQMMFLSHIDVSLSVSPFLSPWKQWKNVCRWGLKKKTWKTYGIGRFNIIKISILFKLKYSFSEIPQKSQHVFYVCTRGIWQFYFKNWNKIKEPKWLKPIYIDLISEW